MKKQPVQLIDDAAQQAGRMAMPPMQLTPRNDMPNRAQRRRLIKQHRGSKMPRVENVQTFRKDPNGDTSSNS